MPSKNSGGIIPEITSAAETVGIFFVGVADLVVKRCDIQWPYLRYAFAVCGVLAFKIAIRVIGFFTRGAMVFLDRIKYM